MHHHTHETPTPTEGRLIRWASRYDLVTNLLTLGQINRLRSMTVDLAMLATGETVLDVGCGTGGVTIPAAQRVGKSGSASGIDPALEMIAVARQKALRRGLTIDFRVGVIEALPFPDDSVDVVTSSLMMHHLPAHLQVSGLAEIYRVLKPGGRLLVADMLSPRSSTGRMRFHPLALGHHGMKSGVEDLQEVVKAAGFRETSLLEARFFIIGFLLARK